MTPFQQKRKGLLKQEKKEYMLQEIFFVANETLNTKKIPLTFDRKKTLSINKSS